MEKAEDSLSSVLLSQIEDALEERQNNDRRKEVLDLPDGVSDERRKGDRRTASAEMTH